MLQLQVLNVVSQEVTQLSGMSTNFQATCKWFCHLLKVGHSIKSPSHVGNMGLVPATLLDYFQD